MYPIIFQLGPLTIYSFGAFMALAALTAVWLVSAELKRRGHNPELASTMVFAAAIGGLIGARLLFIIEEWQGFLAAPMNYIFTGAGFTWYGGFFGGAVAVSWVVRKNKIPWLAGVDIGAPALALAYGVGRIGCHFAGDGDWGAVTDVPWGVAYTKAIVGWADPYTGVPYAPGVLVHPTPIYEFLQGVFRLRSALVAAQKSAGAGNHRLALFNSRRSDALYGRVLAHQSRGWIWLFRGAVVQSFTGRRRRRHAGLSSGASRQLETGVVAR